MVNHPFSQLEEVRSGRYGSRVSLNVGGASTTEQMLVALQVVWNIVDILAFGAFVLRFISLSFRWRCYSFACDDIFDYLDAFFLSVNQCILTSNSTWKHFGDYSGTCGECTWLHLLTID